VDLLLADLLAELLDRTLQARLPLPHRVHVAVLLLEAEVLGYVRLRRDEPGTQLRQAFPRGRAGRLLQFPQIREESRMSPAEGLSN
jgi:hypothetical protein